MQGAARCSARFWSAAALCRFSLSTEQGPIGGLGIHMMRKSLDGMEYRREDGKNLLVMIRVKHSRPLAVKRIELVPPQIPAPPDGLNRALGRARRDEASFCWLSCLAID